MGEVSARADFDGTLPAAEALWYDPRRWPAFIDGFSHVEKLDPAWPAAGARLLWKSNPAGRGLVAETVVEHARGEGQTLEVEDERLRGTQRVEFEQLDGGVEVRLSLAYELKSRNVFTPLVDMFFVRRSLADALQRTVLRFGRELEADLQLLR